MARPMTGSVAGFTHRPDIFKLSDSQSLQALSFCRTAKTPHAPDSIHSSSSLDGRHRDSLGHVCRDRLTVRQQQHHVLDVRALAQVGG